MVLLIDIGNTNIVFGLFNGTSFISERTETIIDKGIEEYIFVIKDILSKLNTNNDIDGVIISSVVYQLNETISKAVEFITNCKAMIVDSKKNTGLRKICTDYPEKVGADLICGAAAAYNKYGGPVIVFDLGTATTVCAVNREGDYLGHSIFPGPGTMLHSLASSTSQLPEVIIEKDEHDFQVIGRNTKESIKSAVIYGTASFIDGMSERYKSILGHEAKVIVTGGFSVHMLDKCSSEIIYNADLVLEGIQLIYNLNKV